eukprot:TRINITY_DN2212_c0_g1_i2.p1 TRINITY_DN2212_c0_g1~~TRINITY_DN2212_c0_g1_i2.p1  ORF type:complete len:389 (+),score=137.35 TRINITY_DN2212_c0_g1_i2:96-1262(+)
MPFTLLVCGDLYQDKVNLEVAFPHRPDLNELRRHIESTFSAEMGVMPKPMGAPAHDQFVVAKMQVYDDVLLKWTDLTQPNQLHEYDQLYCHQPQNPWHSDVEKDLPAPRQPSRPAGFQSAGAGFAPPAAAPPAGFQPQQYPSYPPQQSTPVLAPQSGAPQQQVVPSGALPQPMGNAAIACERPNVPLEERVRVSFAELDEMRKGWVDCAELERSFRTRGIDFSSATVGELFVKADQPRDGRIDLQKWHLFASVYPNTVDAVYYRGRDTRNEDQMKRDLAQAQHDLDQGRQKEQEFRKAAEQQAANNQRLMGVLQDLEGRLRAATERRQLLENQERALIEQEVKLERQKDALRVSVNKFKETASAFDRDAAQNGSPRRSRAPIVDLAGL